MLFNFSQFKFRYLVIFCSAIIIIAFFPVLIFGVRSGHDLPTHLSWFFSTKDAFASSFSYPRWLSDQMDGLGAPTFYFYPPFSTFFSVLVDTFFFGKLPADRVIGISAFLMAVLSAAAFFAWARNHVSGKIALLASTFYAIAPYHLLCIFYTRGALAEYAAYIWVPLIFCGVNKVLTSEKNRWPFFLAIAIAGIFYTHLLTAMLVGPIAFAYSILVVINQNKSATLDYKKVLLLISSATVGVGMAAAFVVPALSMFDQIDSSMLFLVPIEKTALFYSFDIDHITQFGTVLSLIAAIYLLISIYFIAEYKIGLFNTTKTSKYLIVFWMLVLLCVTASMAGKLMFLFQDPSPLRKIQFLWRMMSIMEFSAITLFLVVINNISSSDKRKRIFISGSLIFASFFLLQIFFSFKFIGNEKADKVALFNQDKVKYRLSPPEYFPAGTALSSERGAIVNRLGAHFATAPAGRVEWGDAQIITAARSDAKFVIKVDAREKSVVSIPQFYFPGWRAVDENNKPLRLLAVTEDKLVGFEVLPGVHEVTVTRATTDAEKKGSLVSIASLILFILAMFYFIVQRRRKSKIL